jgi:hypothetical protein
VSLAIAFTLVAIGGIVVGLASFVAVRASGARPAIARRLAGPPEVKVGRLLDADELPRHAVRVTGRIRCRDPLDAGDGEQLVCFHRDVEVRVAGAWRSIERLRETRSFELWDHDGSLTIDPALAAEPLIAIPRVWRGSAGELEEPHASSVARLAERHGRIDEARAITRTINVTDRLLVLARAVPSEQGRVELAPPDGGFLISALALNDAMRLLGGRHRRTAVAGVVGIGLAIVLVAIGTGGAVLSALLGA